MSAQVKSKQRVQEHGEVFTNEREANAMLDMVKQETERIESRFLEPACGDDNFLPKSCAASLPWSVTSIARALTSTCATPSMYLADYREQCLKDVTTQLEPGLFKKVTGLSVKDFELLVSLGVFRDSVMNDAVYKFRLYEGTLLGHGLQPPRVRLERWPVRHDAPRRGLRPDEVAGLVAQPRRYHEGPQQRDGGRERDRGRPRWLCWRWREAEEACVGTRPRRKPGFRERVTRVEGNGWYSLEARLGLRRPGR